MRVNPAGLVAVAPLNPRRFPRTDCMHCLYTIDSIPSSVVSHMERGAAILADAAINYLARVSFGLSCLVDSLDRDADRTTNLYASAIGLTGSLGWRAGASAPTLRSQSERFDVRQSPGLSNARF